MFRIIRHHRILLACLCALIPSCGSQAPRAILTPATEDTDDTLAETSVLLFQWVNTQDVKLEFDMEIDDDAPQHVELGPHSVVNLRLTGECPQMVTFLNVEFGDEFFAGVIPFVQDNVASEGSLAGEEGDFIPATFFCYSAWQLVVNDSNITVAALDRQANSEDEGEGDVDDLLNPPDETATTLPLQTTDEPAAQTGPSSRSNDPDPDPDPDTDTASGINSASAGALHGPSGS